jgi:hypothetical protein
MTEAPENGKESLHSAHANGMNEIPFAPVMNQTTIYWSSSTCSHYTDCNILAQIDTVLFPSEKLCPAALSTISSNVHAHNS